MPQTGSRTTPLINLCLRRIQRKRVWRSKELRRATLVLVRERLNAYFIRNKWVKVLFRTLDLATEQIFALKNTLNDSWSNSSVAITVKECDACTDRCLFPCWKQYRGHGRTRVAEIIFWWIEVMYECKGAYCMSFCGRRNSILPLSYARLAFNVPIKIERESIKSQ